MRLKFSYKVEKEFLNLQAGNRSLNRASQSTFSKKLEALGVNLLSGEAVTTACLDIIAKEGINTQKKVERFSADWQSIEKDVFTRLGRLFEAEENLTEILAYLSLNERCSYNVKEGYFFINMFSDEPKMICIHELLHLFTHKYIKLDVDTKKYNDYKEALTILINTEFNDLTEHEDRGYPQHKKLRDYIQRSFDKGQSILELTQTLFVDESFLKLLATT